MASLKKLREQIEKVMLVFGWISVDRKPLMSLPPTQQTFWMCFSGVVNYKAIDFPHTRVDLINQQLSNFVTQGIEVIKLSEFKNVIHPDREKFVPPLEMRICIKINVQYILETLTKIKLSNNFVTPSCVMKMYE